MTNHFAVTVREGSVEGVFKDSEPATGVLNVSRIVHVFKRWVSQGYQNVQDAAGYTILGEALYDALFDNEVGQELNRRVGDATKEDRLHVSLDVGPYTDIPWEFLKLPKNGEYLAAHPHVALSRYMMLGDEPSLRAPETPKLQFIVVSDPEDPVWSEGLLGDAVKLDQAGKIELLDPLMDPELDDVKQALRDLEPHIVYYLGHGHYNDKTMATGIRLGNAPGSDDPVVVYDDKFATAFGQWVPDLLILQSCETGAAQHSDELASVAGLAPRLMREGVPAVVAMQYEINQDPANEFGRALLENLAVYEVAGVDVAVQMARVAMAESKEQQYADRDFAAPLLYLHTEPESSSSTANGDDSDALDEADAWFSVKVRDMIFAKSHMYGDDAPFAINDEIVGALIPAIRAGRSGTREVAELLGITMYRALLPDDIGLKFRKLRERASNETPLRLRLEIEDDEIDSYPWEYLHSPPPAENDFLAQARDVAVTRYRPGSLEPLELEARKPRVLFVVSQPQDRLERVIHYYKTEAKKKPRLDLDQFPEEYTPKKLAAELAEIVTKSNLAKVDRVYKSMKSGKPDPLFGFKELDDELEFLRRCEEAPDRDNLHHRYPDVLHYIGHGSADGKLLFHDPEQRETSDWIEPKRFADELFDGKPPPPLIVLHLCQGDENSVGASFRAYAPLLLKAGARAVVATQYPLRREHAVEFINEFYGNLGKTTVERAVQTARSEVRKQEGASLFFRDFAAPMLYTSSKDGLRLVKPVAPPAPTSDVSGGKGHDTIHPAVAEALRELVAEPDDEAAEPSSEDYGGTRTSTRAGPYRRRRPPL